MVKSRRGAKGYNIQSLPYKTRVYINNQVLIPAQLARKLNLKRFTYARITLRHNDRNITIKVKLIKFRNTDSLQFTILKDVRRKYGIISGDE
ncbi:MAG TPA: AbrB/MazE/SpoVT family DNA-binding domain-containing protein, partial [Thermoproteales archaeon]|nr:AbrB/MazE/SpoVT family DNA-binding domain-containing protein [Thermoproteales archaeon]